MADEIDDDTGLRMMKQKRTTLRRMTTTLINKIEREVNSPSTTVSNMKVHYEQLSAKEKLLFGLDEEIINLSEDEETLNQEMENAESYREGIVRAKCLLTEFIESRRLPTLDYASINPSANGNGSVHSQERRTPSIKLPKLVIEKFMGDPSQWNGFWSQFEMAIHNTAEDDVTKFGYLRSYVGGEAAGSIAGFSLTSANYKKAVDKLKNRFGRTRIIKSAHMKNLLSENPVKDMNDIKGLRKLYDRIEVQIRSLETMGVPLNSYDVMFMPLLRTLIPDEMSYEFDRKHPDDDDYGGEEILEFVRQEIEGKERHAILTGSWKSLQPKKPQFPQNSHQDRFKARNFKQENAPRMKIPTAAVLHVNASKDVEVNPELECIFCEKTTHKTKDCTSYSATERKDILRRKARCFICMQYRHRARDCKAELSCPLCQKRHEVSVCEMKFPDKGKEREAEQTISQNCAPLAREGREEVVYLKTAGVLAIHEDSSMNIRLFLDDGSQRTFIREDVSRKLNLPTMGIENVKIFAFESTIPTIVKRRRVRLTLKDLETEMELTIEALESPKLCSGTLQIPSLILQEEMSNRGLKLADENLESKEIDLLIGSEYYWKVVTGRMEFLTQRLAAVETIFGWTVHGFSEGSDKEIAVNSVTVLSVTSLETEEELASQQLKKLWELDAIGISDQTDSLESTEEGKAIELFKSTIKFENNRYEVNLPWREEKELSSTNYGNARKRFESLKKRFIKNPELYLEYSKVINDYLRQGIAEKVLMPGSTNKVFYLPHHPIIDKQRTSTKLRVVFDGSAKEEGHPSLNECLYTGPTMNTDLLKQLITFRMKKVAFTADIEKAFLQVSLAESDRDLVRFLWTENPQEATEPLVLRMTRVLFGVSPSPFLLAATIRHHIEKYKNTHPEVYELLLHFLYVDDLTGGEDDVRKALEITRDSKEIMMEANMNLRKWKTNSRELRENWDETMKEKEELTEHQDGFSLLKVLGIKWNPEQDVIQFDATDLLNFLEERKDTKRFVLKASSRIFDPVGYLAPFIIRVKCLFQEIWERGTDWDESLPSDIQEKWNKWCEELPALNEVYIPRYYFEEAEDGIIRNVELHCFSDSSEKAYAAALYLRFKTKNEKIRTILVTSKTRVAPLKKITLPRLELMGAVIAVRLMNHTKDYFSKLNPRMFYWTDSTITLNWIQGSANRWKPFVANRVREIQQGSEPSTWKHCPGRYNPADFLTRGMKLQDLLQNTSWWTGPEFLRTEVELPKPSEVTEHFEIVNEELRPKFDEIIQSPCVMAINEPLFNLEEKSKLSRVIRITAWIMRFIENCKKGNEKKKETSLDSEEVRKAELYWIKRSQAEVFGPELKILEAKKIVPKESKLYDLSPFLDEEGALRVGGRLKLAEFSYAERHPYIIPEKHYFAKLQILYHHEKSMHGGLSATLTHLRETFWVIRGRQVAKSILKKCMTCKRYNAKPPIVATAPLPKERMLESRPFDVTGIDFAGPVYVEIEKESKKAYIALFTCSTTRAIHLELVTDLTTDKFLLALRRFFARRGICSEIQSDNAKTFKRAEKDLEELFKLTKEPPVQNYVGQEGIKWTYIIERASWWGGYWERLVRTVKTALRKNLGKTSLSFEEFQTTLSETEAVLNSRPLSYVMNDKDEPVPLAPSDFLTGRKVTLLPPRTFTKVQLKKNDLKKRLLYRQTLLDSFWRRWRKEYLLELRSAHRSQFVKGTKEFEVNDVVLITEDVRPRSMWKMGKITEVFRGRDGLIRSCSLKTLNGNIIKRPVQLLCNLEVND